MANLASCLTKFSYPITGNLSTNVQKSLENKLGKESYNANHAFTTSLLTNIALYSGIGAYIASKTSGDPVIGAIIGATAAGTELWGRGYLSIRLGDWMDDHFEKPVASIPGKIASLPFDLQGFYAKTKAKTAEFDLP